MTPALGIGGTMQLSSFVTFIKSQFQGTFVTIRLVGGGTVTGEVFDGFDNFIGLKSGGFTTYVNAAFIASII